MSAARTNWIVGLTLLALVAAGAVARAGNKFGGNVSNWSQQRVAAGDCAFHERDSDGDGIPNSEDPDWICPLDGSGYGERQGYGQSRAVNRPLDGTGFGARQSGGTLRSCGGEQHNGSCS